MTWTKEDWAAYCKLCRDRGMTYAETADHVSHMSEKKWTPAMVWALINPRARKAQTAKLWRSTRSIETINKDLEEERNQPKEIIDDII